MNLWHTIVQLIKSTIILTIGTIDSDSATQNILKKIATGFGPPSILFPLRLFFKLESFIDNLYFNNIKMCLGIGRKCVIDKPLSLGVQNE
jgi:hypothetical protein